MRRRLSLLTVVVLVMCISMCKLSFGSSLLDNVNERKATVVGESCNNVNESKATVIGESCNIDIEKSECNEYKFDYDVQKFDVTSQIVEDNYIVNIKAKNGISTGLFDRVKVYIPSYTASIDIVSKKAGISIGKINSELNIDNEEGSVSLSIPDNFTHNVNYISNKGSNSINIDAKLNNYTLNLYKDNSAASLDEYFKSDVPNNNKYVYGDGAAKINVNLKYSSAAIKLDK